jgi:voltage-gated potassium channel
MLKRLKRALEDPGSTTGRTFDLSVQALILVSVVTFSVETLPDLSPAMRRWLDVAETVTVLLFTAEYLLRLLVADRKRSFVFSFFGMIDLVAILPFYVASGLDLRSVRVLRFLRLFRVLKLARYTKAIERFRRAFLTVREELVLFGVVALMVLYFSAVGIYYFENDAQPAKFASVFHSLWWAVTTLTTVGYGDVVPVTVGGKVFTFVVVLVGLGIVSVPTGLIASGLSKARAIDEPGDE